MAFLVQKFFEMHIEIDQVLSFGDDIKSDEEINMKIVSASTSIKSKIIAIQHDFKSKITNELLEKFIYSLVALFDKRLTHYLMALNLDDTVISNILNQCCLEYAIFRTNNIEAKIIEFINQFNDHRNLLDKNQDEIIVVYIKLLNICFYDLDDIEKYMRKLYRLMYKEEPTSQHRIFNVFTNKNFIKIRNNNIHKVIFILAFLIYMILSSVVWIKCYSNLCNRLNNISTIMDIK